MLPRKFKPRYLYSVFHDLWVWLVFYASCSFLISPALYAQTGDFVPERFGVPQQPFAEEPLEQPKQRPRFTLPPIPKPPADEQRLSSQQKISIKMIKLSGNTVFSDDQLQHIISKYEDREITQSELQTLRKALTIHYVQAGYVNSGALIPDQTVDDGVLEINIIEGRLTDISVKGKPWLRDSYINNRLWLGNRDVLNINQLQQRLVLLQQDRLIDRLNAELIPGLQRGEGVLNIEVVETRPYEFGVSFNNQRSTSIGELRGEVYGSIYNLTGFGDALSLRYGVTDGLNDGSVSYSLPLTARNTRLNVHYSRSDSTVVEKPFDQVDIDSETESFGLTLSHPFYRSVNSQLTTSITIERRHSETFLLGEPFAFATGTDNGKSNVTVLRFANDWVTRSQKQVIALRSSLNFGVDLLGATNNSGNEADGQFFSWLGQIQYVRRLWDSDNQMILRGNIQLSPDRLLPLEKFAIGGLNNVRGYRENLLVRDNGASASLELRIPVFRLPIPYLSDSRQDGMIQLAPFFDFGWSEDTDSPSPGFTTISSAGIGIRWDPHRKVHSELYWGYSFRDINNNSEKGLQDNGIHFLLNIQLF
ncbi:MAG: ShlB/FhaC/HecB family hemolysin secretion/activation protein [Methylococcales bacterium]